MNLTLYTYFRSSAAWRVRIALAWKELDYTAVPVHLLRDGGEQHAEHYRRLNPQELVPALCDGDQIITQSMAICEYLDETHPTPPLMPADPLGRARVRALAQAVACDIHPINNLRVLQHLKRDMGHSQEDVDGWIKHWVTVGFASLEQQLARLGSKDFCYGGTLSLADICLVPQVFNARRFNVDLTPYPHIVQIDAHLMSLPAFAETQPSHQADAE